MNGSHPRHENKISILTKRKAKQGKQKLEALSFSVHATLIFILRLLAEFSKFTLKKNNQTQIEAKSKNNLLLIEPQNYSESF